MIDDLDNLPQAAVIDCDLCIVGSGAAGLALATELLPSNAKILILESGAAPFEPATQSLYESVIAGLPFHGHIDGRFRTYGGSTTRWGGQALPLERLDFVSRNWVAHSGWPLRAAELASYYSRAGAFLQTRPGNYDTDLFELLRFTPPALDPHLARYHYSKWSRRPNLRDTYGPPIVASNNVTILMHANLVRITLTESGSHVSELEARSLAGKSVVIRPKHVALCTGGIETARILLSNDQQQKKGIGNEHDLVGRFFQDHPIAPIGIVHSDTPDRLQHYFHTFYCKGLKYAPRVSLSEEVQTKRQTLNASAIFQFDAGIGSPYHRLKEIFGAIRTRRLNRDLLKQSAGAIVHAPALARPIFKYVVRKRGYSPSPVIRLLIAMEQEPNRQSRIVLSDQTDALGIPKTEIRWQLTDLTLHTLLTFAGILSDELVRLKLGNIEIDPRLSPGSSDWQTLCGDQNHHIGTTRMSESKADGVVDKHCCVHGIDNLRIAGSAVFPTGGHSNPTLTLIALTMRMADEFKTML